ncbi:phage tail assembly protein [Spartinivicinus poritis]|uniref:Phage tail assembly protein n=1 Tax=Spartinivicinus poritis TaxID=2994640 RepID=A0ABT5UEI5_9GAMM|nr:phage tail assembly protein [Spartinivicinus sp. A2-2]MDE1464782.1 phage tail assembly protein [Spartinivicinus sp. A2-2]
MTTTITLTSPIKRGDTTIDQVTLREPRAGELRRLKLMDVIQQDVSSLRILLPRICELTANEVDELSLVDLGNIASEVTLFFMDSTQYPAM